LGQITVSSGEDVVKGTLSADGLSWQSNGKLSFGTTYTVTAALTGSAAHRIGSFSTVAASAASSVRVSSVLGDHKVYGVGMPIILKLDRALVTPVSRATFENALLVKSQPPTTGAWGWINGREVHFRPQAYWAAGSKIHLEVNTAGRDLIGGLWGRTDLTVDFTIGRRRELLADAVTKQLRVIETGKLVRTIPVSLGKPSRPSSSGIMTIIDKRPTALFDSSTYGLPVDAPDGYRTKVQYAMRLTWGGEFIHAAPWSVSDQGHRNVSHGCLNVSTANAAWLFARVQVGDPVAVTRTGTPVAVGNGWSDWSVPFTTWTARSETGVRVAA
jgi:lipoprotein-anchoring transpeptidase ErfK/SrfK